jgi:hypothetical protein
MSGQLQPFSGQLQPLHTIASPPPHSCVCVCVCARAAIRALLRLCQGPIKVLFIKAALRCLWGWGAG